MDPVLDTARAVSAEVFGGQTLQATAADGTTYTLEVPQRALPAPVTITMTPVTAVQGSPLEGRLLGAVQLEPHGLQLLQPATLTIDPPGDTLPPAIEQAGFLFHEEGEDFHLFPLTLGTSELRMSLTHFSTPGATQASRGAISYAYNFRPSRAQAALEAEVAELIREERARQEADPDGAMPPEVVEALVDNLLGFYDQVVLPAATAADRMQASREQIAYANSQLLGWMRQVQLLSLESHERLAPVMDFANAILRSILDKAVRSAAARCQDRELHDISVLLSLARVAALLGDPLDQVAVDEMQRCARFRVEFTSRINGSSAGPCCEGEGTSTADRDLRVRASVPIELDFTFSLRGEAPLVDDGSSSLRVTESSCGSGGGTYRNETRLVGTSPGTMDLLLGLDLQLREPGAPPPPADYDMTVRRIESVGSRFTERYVHTSDPCGDRGPESSDPVDEPVWESFFDSFHIGEFARPWEDFVPGSRGTEIVGTKTYGPRTNRDGLTERTTIVVRHTPN